MLYRIRKLEWKERLDGHGRACWQAESPAGWAHIQLNGDKYHFWVIETRDEQSSTHSLLSGAKAAAEEWYRNKLLEALEPATPNEIAEVFWSLPCDQVSVPPPKMITGVDPNYFDPLASPTTEKKG